MRRSSTLALLVLGAAACAKPSHPSNVAPSSRTVVAETEPGIDSQDLYIINNSSEPIVITSITLRTCENVEELCAQVHVHVPVPARSRRRVASVHAADRSQAFSFQYSWTWSAAPSPAPQ